MTMKKMRSVMYHILCFDWLAEKSRKVVSIDSIQAAMASGMVTYASLIAYYVTNIRPWIGGILGCGEVQYICAIVVPP